jgi:hypothetical protein
MFTYWSSNIVTIILSTRTTFLAKRRGSLGHSLKPSTSPTWDSFNSTSALEVICKDVNQLQIQKRYSDVFLSLDRLFDSAQEEALDWHNVERIHTATRARNDLLFTTEFKMPQGSYTPTDLVTPRIFGDAFMFVFKTASLFSPVFDHFAGIVRRSHGRPPSVLGVLARMK